MANLSDLPMEMMERILDFLTNRESRLTLRRTCKNLCAKTLRSFSREYFNESCWTLNATNARAILHFSNSPEVASHLTSIGLIAPTRARSHHNIWVAKDIDPTKLAIAISQFTQLRSSILDGFSHPKLRGCEARTFVRYFSKHLMAPVLDTLFLSVMAATQRDVTRLITSHENTLTNLHLKDVDLVYTKSIMEYVEQNKVIFHCSSVADVVV